MPVAFSLSLSSLFPPSFPLAFSRFLSLLLLLTRTHSPAFIRSILPWLRGKTRRTTRVQRLERLAAVELRITTQGGFRRGKVETRGIELLYLVVYSIRPYSIRLRGFVKRTLIYKRASFPILVAFRSIYLALRQNGCSRVKGWRLNSSR